MRVLLIPGLLLLFIEDCFLILDTAASNMTLHVNTNLSKVPQFYLRAPNFDDRCFVSGCSLLSIICFVPGEMWNFGEEPKYSG